MAIIKNITLENGVEVNYHRIVSVNNVTNHSSIIEIASYPNKSKRTEEKANQLNNEPMNIFINTEYLSISYDPTLTVNTAYQYLKSLNKFSGYSDDIE